MRPRCAVLMVFLLGILYNPVMMVLNKRVAKSASKVAPRSVNVQDSTHNLLQLVAHINGEIDLLKAIIAVANRDVSSEYFNDNLVANSKKRLGVFFRNANDELNYLQNAAHRSMHSDSDDDDDDTDEKFSKNDSSDDSSDGGGFFGIFRSAHDDREASWSQPPDVDDRTS